MILHVFSDSPYTYRFIDFVNLMFDPADHQFIVLLKTNSRFADFYNKVDNCSVAYTRMNFFKTAFKFVNARKIIFHQLNQPRLLLFLSVFYPASLKKSTWAIWGGDAYFHRYKSNSIKDNLIEKVLAHSIRKFPTIAAYIPGDYDVAKARYGTKAKYIHASYPSPVDVSSIAKVKENEKIHSTITIMVGNSADPLNEHINAFKLLSQYKDNDIKVVAVLSYGGSKEYAESVIESGRKIFGEKFMPITEYMAFDDYLDFVSKVDICVFNHKQQQGLGTLFLFFALGSKVFISNQTTPFDYYKSIGVDLFATEHIEYMVFKKFCEFCASSRQANIHIIKSERDLNVIKSDWEKVFND